MGIKKETIANQSLNAIRSHLQKNTKVDNSQPLMRSLAIKVGGVDVSNQEETSLSQFQTKTYSLNIDDLQNDQFLSKVKYTGLKLLGMEGEHGIKELAVCDQDTVVSQSDRASSLGTKIMDAVKFVQGLQQTKENDYEIKLLSIPSLHTFILWLHPDEDFREGVDDLFVPVTDFYGRLNTNQCYDKEQLRTILKPEAAKAVKKWNKKYI